MTTRYELAGCPVCGASDAATIADSTELREEMELLWSFHTRRVHGETPADRLHDRASFSQAPPLRVAQCGGCGLIYRNPREKPESLVEKYAGEEPDDAVLTTLLGNQLNSARQQIRRLTNISGGTGRGLEVGSYVGAFLSAARERGWSFVGVDVNEAANRFARAQGFQVVNGTVEDVTEGDFDAVAFWNCFDQLPDPRAAARHARTLLNPGGLLALRMPNGAFYAAWRRRLRSPVRRLAVAALAHNNLLTFPYRHGFTLGSLRTLLADAGFDMLHAAGDTLVPIADRFTRGWARAEEAILKSALRRLPPRHAPWIEVYARAS